MTSHVYDLTDKKYLALLKYTEPIVYRNLEGKIIECELQRYMYRALLKYSETLNCSSIEATCICLICEDLLNGSNVQDEMRIGRKFVTTILNLPTIFRKYNETETDLAQRSIAHLYKVCRENVAEIKKRIQENKELQKIKGKNTVINVKLDLDFTDPRH